MVGWGTLEEIDDESEETVRGARSSLLVLFHAGREGLIRLPLLDNKISAMQPLLSSSPPTACLYPQEACLGKSKGTL